MKPGADEGIDGKITFTGEGGVLESVIVSVKTGKVQRRDLADLKNSVVREKAAMGVLVTLEEPTAPMRKEVATAGIYRSDLFDRTYPRMQILTFRELLEEKRRPELPALLHRAYSKAERYRPAEGEQIGAFDGRPATGAASAEDLPPAPEEVGEDLPDGDRAIED